MKILLVDDEVFAIQGILDSVNWTDFPFEEILTANNFQQAVACFGNKKIDILLCDIEMPNGTGLDLVRWVREHSPDTECIFLTCHDRFDFARQAIQLQCFDYLLKPATPEKIQNLLKRAAEAVRQNHQKQYHEVCGKQYIQKQSQELSGESPNTDIVAQAEEYIEKHISAKLSVEEIARQLYVNPDTLTRLFKKKRNTTLIDYIVSQRMMIARNLLEENKLSLSEISLKVGYNNYSHFTTMFRKHYGKSPREYQSSRMHAQKEDSK